MALPSLSHPGYSPSDLPAKASDGCDGSCPSDVVLRSTRRTLWRGPRTERLSDWCEASPGLPALLPFTNGIFNDINYQVPTMDPPSCEWVTSGKPRGEERHARVMPVLVNRVRTRKTQVHLHWMWTTAKTGRWPSTASHGRDSRGRTDFGPRCRVASAVDLGVAVVREPGVSPRTRTEAPFRADTRCASLQTADFHMRGSPIHRRNSGNQSSLG